MRSETRPTGRRSGPTLVLTLLVAVSACTAGGLAPVSDGQVTVTGVVVEIVDRTPVDGDLRLALAGPAGERETLLFGSLFTFPAPAEERLELHRRAREARVGSRVRATGIPTPDGLEVTDFAVLDR